jgi:hypothetical protein
MEMMVGRKEDEDEEGTNMVVEEGNCSRAESQSPLSGSVRAEGSHDRRAMMHLFFRLTCPFGILLSLACSGTPR